MILFYVLEVLFLTHTSGFQYLPMSDPYNYVSDMDMIGASGDRFMDIGRVPHHVLIVRNHKYCSGCLISSRAVLTTASCITLLEGGATNYTIKLGTNSVTGHGYVRQVLAIKKHEYFKHRSEIDNDIAILLLKSNVVFGVIVKKAIVVESNTALRSGTHLLVSGWGSNNIEAKYMSKLIWSEMLVTNKEQCEKYYSHIITSSSFCVKYTEDHRLSDCGGPAMYKHFLVGLVSFGATNKLEPHIAVLTNVSYFNRWIEMNIERLHKRYCKDGGVKQDTYENENELTAYRTE